MTASGPPTKILALHGFLGLPSDWDQIDFGAPVETIDLWSEVSSTDDIARWALTFNSYVRSLRAAKPVLLGYSMGGRLAMQALLQAPELYRAAVIVSAHPGLTNEGERADRLASDQKWAERFRTEEWSALMAAWQGQGVLKPSSEAQIEMIRREREFDREDLARALEIWSLGRQPDLRSLLSSLQVPVLFMSGSEDAKFTRLLGELQLTPKQALRVIENAGHRVPWEQPQSFISAVREFLATTSDLC